MRSIVIAKYVSALAGLLVFGAGMRWTGIGIVAVAWFLRFLKEPPQAESAQSDSPAND